MAGALLILGAGGHGRAVADVAREAGWDVRGFTDRAAVATRPDVLGVDDDLPELVRRLHLTGGIVGVGATALAARPALFRRLHDVGLPAPSLVHPRAVLSGAARVGAGTVVFPQAVLGVGVTVGQNVVVYSAAVVEHDSVIGDDAWISPGAIVAGGVRVGAGAFLGAGAVVTPGVTVGERAVVAAGAVVVTAVAPGETVVGVPARPRGRP